MAVVERAAIQVQPFGGRAPERRLDVDDPGPAALDPEGCRLAQSEFDLAISVEGEDPRSFDVDWITERYAAYSSDMDGPIEPGRNRDQEGTSSPAVRRALDDDAEVVLVGGGFEESADGRESDRRGFGPGKNDGPQLAWFDRHQIPEDIVDQ